LIEVLEYFNGWENGAVTLQHTHSKLFRLQLIAIIFCDGGQ